MRNIYVLIRKNILTLFILAILFVAIPIGLYLVKNTQIFRPKASTTLSGIPGIQTPIPITPDDGLTFEQVGKIFDQYIVNQIGSLYGVVLEKLIPMM